MQSGFVAIIGRPNAGKSSLLNALLKEKVSIISQKAQTTRNAIVGIYNDKDLQIVFTDTPGIHKAASGLGNYMNKEALAQVEGVDVIYYIIDGIKGFSSIDEKILKSLKKRADVPLFLLINKIDKLAKEELIKIAAFANEHYEFKEIIPLSALNNENLDELIKTTRKYLHDNVTYYPGDMKTSSSLAFRIAEIIREKVLMTCREEIPHLVATKVDNIENSPSKMLIDATIICNKATHKGIIIGSAGNNLRKINTLASKDIRSLVNKRVELSLFVKVEEDWINKTHELLDLGYFVGDKYER